MIFPFSLASLGGNSFKNCSSLEYVEFNLNITTIGDSAFANCSSLIEAWSSTESKNLAIGNNAFADCISLFKIELSTAVTIGNNAFVNCHKLNQITTFERLTYIGESAFEGCSEGYSTNRFDLNFLPSVTYIGNNAFKECSALSKLVLPPSLTYIGNIHSINVPSPTITTKDRLAYINCEPFIYMQYGHGYSVNTNIPASAVTTTPKHNLVSICHKHYLMNPQFSSSGGSIEKPCFTLIARMDKMPPYLVATEPGRISIKIYETDSPMTIKIKEFMAIYSIADIKMRMLKIHELKQIMGFPKDYVLIGTQADQKKFIGNAVEVTMARVLCQSLSKKLKEVIRKAA